jgi:hypothetical protein
LGDVESSSTYAKKLKFVGIGATTLMLDIVRQVFEIYKLIKTNFIYVHV